MFDHPQSSAAAAELAVLGCASLSRRATLDATEWISTDDFGEPQHAMLWSALIESALGDHADDEHDPVLVAAKLEAAGIQGPAAAQLVASAMSAQATSANIEHYAQMLKSRGRSRRLRVVLEKTLRDLPHGDPDVALEELHAQIVALDGKHVDRGTDFGASAAGVYELTTAAHEGRAPVRATTGLREVDEILVGLEPGDLCIVGARPSHGKSAIALHIAHHVATRLGRVEYFSLEMPHLQLSLRLLSKMSGVPATHIRTGTLRDWGAFTRAVGQAGAVPIVFRDAAAAPIEAIERCVARVAQREKLAMVVVDYVQLVRGRVEKNGNRELEVASVARALKHLAGRYRVPVVACSQLNRAVESRADRTPSLADLRESGNIENDADQVLMLQRPWMNMSETERQNCRERMFETNIIIAKNRQGALGQVTVHFDPRTTSFDDMEDAA